MTPEQQRIAIAEACNIPRPRYKNHYGWPGLVASYCCKAPVTEKGGHFESSNCDPGVGYHNTIYSCDKCGRSCSCFTIDKSRESDYILSQLPDYPNDLNAMHEAEKTLTDEQYVIFKSKLQVITIRDMVPIRLLSATAAQRAEAFCHVKCPERFK